MDNLPLEFNDSVKEIIHPMPEKEVLLAPGNASMIFVWCPAGSFMMGSPETETGHYVNETLHEEIIENGFWIGKYPVTEEQYNPLTSKTSLVDELGHLDQCAAKGNITYKMAVDFCELMNKSLNLDGLVASLPSSAQWEYACRAGCTSALNHGKEITWKYGRCWNLGEVAWNPLDKVDSPQPVGRKTPNAWGIYDMHGNVWEWCTDKYIHISKKGIAAEARENLFVVRGGSFKTPPKYCRAACVKGMFDYTDKNGKCDHNIYKDFGFRIVLENAGVK